jgi:hypothetical protein
MSGAIPLFLQYAFMAWCSVKAQGQLYLYIYQDRGENPTLRSFLISLHSFNIAKLMKLRSVRWVGHVGRIRAMRCVYKISVAKPQWKRTFGRDLSEIG